MPWKLPGGMPHLPILVAAVVVDCGCELLAQVEVGQAALVVDCRSELLAQVEVGQATQDVGAHPAQEAARACHCARDAANQQNYASYENATVFTICAMMHNLIIQC